MHAHSTLLQQAQLSGVTHFEYAHYSELEPVEHLLPGMPNLEHLCLTGHLQAAAVMLVLPAHSLTALTFNTYVRDEVDDTWLVKLRDSASRLVNLRKLKLAALLNPVALACMALLTKLELLHCQPAARVGDSTTGCLAAVRGMRQLQHLAVFNNDQHDAALLQAAEPRACAP